MAGFPSLHLPEVAHFNGIAIVDSASSEPIKARLKALAASAVLGKGGKRHASCGRGVDADAHVGQVVNGVDLDDIVPHLGFEVVGIVDGCAGHFGIYIRGYGRPIEFFVGVVYRRCGAVTGVGDGLAVGQGWTGELDREWSARHDNYNPGLSSDLREFFSGECSNWGNDVHR